MKQHTDFLIIGSGIAGLFYALKVAERNPGAQIVLITKKGERDTNTNKAQGGIAAVLSGTDSFEAHVQDTVTSGAGLCHIGVVEKIIEAGPSAVEELIRYGVQFTQGDSGYDLGREGGHSAKRVLHAADFTGQEIERALLETCRQTKQVTILRDHIALDLLVSQRDGADVCSGALILSSGEMKVRSVSATVTLLATGGLGQIYLHTTNPRIATGDGVAIAYRAGVPVANLEFIQFHPTVLYNPGRWPFLISEAVRGEGARLKSVDDRFFMEQAHPLKELAPRDIVARAIDKEMKTSGEDYVMLDISHQPAEFIKERFPGIYRTCLERGFDITKRPIPVVPAAHYSCGGVVATVKGETTLPGLYVAGEVAMTGMHGANRLASNSLLEAVVMASLAASSSTGYYAKASAWIPANIDAPQPSGIRNTPEKLMLTHERNELNRVMSDFVGIVRQQKRLQLALEKIIDIKQEVEEYCERSEPTYGAAEVRNMTLVAKLIIECALSRTESRGLHYNEDFPSTDPAQVHDTILQPPMNQAVMQ